MICSSTLFSIVLSLSVVLPSYAVSVQRADVDKSDWKYAVGWDGVTLPSDAFETTIDASNDTTSVAHIEKRTVGGVYICTDTDWKGTCGYAVQPLNTCIRMGQAWAFQISSFGPDKCTTCLAWPNYSCLDSWEWSFQSPGDSSGGLRGGSSNGPWNDLIASFKCFASC